MGKSQEIAVTVRENPTSGKFQTQLKLQGVMDADTFAKWWADISQHKAFQIRQMIMDIEGGIMAALQQGYQVNLGLASFYPRLSGALPKRNSDPGSEGLFVRGAVKARSALFGGLANELVAVNALSNAKSRIMHILDTVADTEDAIAAGHTIRATGFHIPIEAGRDDEGVWLAKKRKREMVKVAQARIIDSKHEYVAFAFDETPPPGKYLLVVGTRGGRTEHYQVTCLRRMVTVG